MSTQDLVDAWEHRTFTKGKAEGKAESLLLVLEARGLRLSADARRRITGCTKPAQLERWLRRAVDVSTVDELFSRATPGTSSSTSSRTRTPRLSTSQRTTSQLTSTRRARSSRSKSSATSS